jgi:hypothetical protein
MCLMEDSIDIFLDITRCYKKGWHSMIYCMRGVYVVGLCVAAGASCTHKGETVNNMNVGMGSIKGCVDGIVEVDYERGIDSEEIVAARKEIAKEAAVALLKSGFHDIEEKDSVLHDAKDYGWTFMNGNEWTWMINIRQKPCSDMAVCGDGFMMLRNDEIDEEVTGCKGYPERRIRLRAWDGKKEAIMELDRKRIYLRTTMEIAMYGIINSSKIVVLRVDTGVIDRLLYDDAEWGFNEMVRHDAPRQYYILIRERNKTWDGNAIVSDMHEKGNDTTRGYDMNNKEDICKMIEGSER